MSQTRVNLLEKAHSTTILRLLLQHELRKSDEPIIKGILYQMISKNTKSLSDRLDELKEAGLLTITVSESHPFPQYIELTPLGREVAEHLQAIVELMQRR